tara:strand:+ start:494 stop:1159 length:666 start_codon:yes stop_codon:yes gene_type:complete
MENNTSTAKVRFHGNLGKRLNKKNWDLSIDSVQEAFRAVDILSKRKLTKCFIEDDKKKLRYQIKVNNKAVDTSKIDYENLSTVYNTELCIKRKIESIDIIPLVEGSGSKIMGAVMTVVGVILVVAGMVGGGNPLLISAGLTLIAGGVSMLLAKPPKFDDFREIENTKKSSSYLFNGPTNTANEGGPVPIGYGRLIVGSQVIQTSINTRQMTVEELGTYRPS